MTTEEICTCESCRIRALASHLEVDIEDISPERCIPSGYNAYEYGNETYLVLTDDEADELASEYIKDSLWAFNASFIIDHSKLPYEALEMIESFQAEKCESANETIEAMIDDIDEFIEDAIGADGRGHFISQYDGEEAEAEGFYIYRTD
jgi:hypothetical protein